METAFGTAGDVAAYALDLGDGTKEAGVGLARRMAADKGRNHNEGFSPVEQLTGVM
jgi:hypothetical protein